MNSIIFNKYLLVLPILLILLLFAVNIDGCVSYVWALLIFVGINVLLDKEYRDRNFIFFHFFLFLAIVVYVVNIHQFPYSYGMSSGELGSGTDDVFYYRSIRGAVLPIELKMTRTSDRYFYSEFLRYTYPFRIDDPIKMVIMNVLWGLTFLPYFTAKVAIAITGSKKVADLAYLLIAFCPFCWSGGLLIMRDVVGATVMMAAIYYLFEKKYLIAGPLIILLFFLKEGFVVFFLISALTIYYTKFCATIGKKVIFVVLSLIFVSIFIKAIIPSMSSFSGGRIEDGEIFRLGFVSFLTESDANSILAKIYQLPLLIRFPLLVLAFITIPMLRFGFGYNSVAGFITPVGFMRFLYSIYFICVSGGLFRLVTNYTYKNNISKLLILLIILNALGLGVISLQLRHKAILMPFMYIAIAYGYSFYKKNPGTQIMQIAFLLMNLAYAAFF